MRKVDLHSKGLPLFFNIIYVAIARMGSLVNIVNNNHLIYGKQTEKKPTTVLHGEPIHQTRFTADEENANSVSSSSVCVCVYRHKVGITTYLC